MTTEPTAAIGIEDAPRELYRDIADAYDSRVYTSNAFPFSSPGHLRAAALLYGLDSVPLQKARVLELGCAGGGNLLPFAVAYPEAHVVGVDLSAIQVGQGQQVAAQLDVDNLHLHAMSLTDITAEFGQFDYIIAHGVFSWVPPEVREAMLRILRDNLSPNGIGYISYNTYPGWKAGDIVRDAMLLHSHGGDSDEIKLASAKAVLNLLSDGIAGINPLAPSLKAAVGQLKKQSDYYIAHEYLEKFNNPCYLLEFVNLVDQYALTHLGDADPHVELSATYGQNVQLNHSLVALGQPREMRQQYLDFAVGRNFRKSLIVHKDRANQVSISPELDRLADLRWAGHFTEIEDEGRVEGRLTFRSYKNQPLYTGDPTVVAIVRTLSEVWPSSMDFDTLLVGVQGKLSKEEDEPSARKAVLDALKTLFRLNSLRYTLEPSPYEFAREQETDGPRLVPGLAHLYQQRQDPGFGIGTYSLWHDSINLQLKEAEAFLLPYIDGTHSRKKLSTLLRDALNRGTVQSTDGKSLKGQRNLDALADKTVGKLLDLLKRQGALW